MLTTEKLYNGQIINDKYRITTETITAIGPTGPNILHRIQAIRDFADVHEGDLGGWISLNAYLSFSDNAWIYDNAKLFDLATVTGDACLRENAQVGGFSRIRQNATITNGAIIDEYADIFGHAFIGGDVKIGGNARLGGDVHLTSVKNLPVCDYDYKVSIPVCISHTPTNYCIYGPLGSRNSILTFYTTTDGKIWAETWYFTGSIDELEKHITERYANPDNDILYKYYRQYMFAIENAKTALKTGLL